MAHNDNGITTPFINLMSDFGFKRTFGTERFRLALIRFLDAALGDEITVTQVKFCNKEILPSIKEGKRILYDVYCTMKVPAGDSKLKRQHLRKDMQDNPVEHHFILEMQNVYEPPFEDRMLFYASKIMAEQGRKGWNYDLDPVILIAITDFDLPGEVPAIAHEYELRERTSGATLTDKLRMLFYSLRKVPKEWEDCQNELERRLFLIKNMDKMDKNSKPYKEGGYEDMFDAAESTLIVGEDAVLYSQSLDRLINSQAAVDYSHEQGLEQGRKEGRKEGIISVALRMKQQGISKDMISSFTGLDNETIKNL